MNNLEVENEENSDGQKYLQFDLGTEGYAVHLLLVKEVIPLPETTALPNSPAHYVGIMNLRGQIISIVDLRKKLKITPSEKTDDNAVVIVELEGICIGLIVDGINRVIKIKKEDVSEVPEVGSQLNAKYMEGVYQGDDHLIVMLDLESIFDIQELKKLSEKLAA